MKTILLSSIIVLCAGLLSACHTVEGLGKDVKGVGQSVENAASRK